MLTRKASPLLRTAIFGHLLWKSVGWSSATQQIIPVARVYICLTVITTIFGPRDIRDCSWKRDGSIASAQALLHC
ncbi:hypothetical protein TcWFU_008554 [Taenia crassiceps]|uniref:Secreted protein n=1 Tax=Taenia crassiceps TaxID=6207 RepID=A0ABR4QMZ0_9CEST